MSTVSDGSYLGYLRLRNSSDLLHYTDQLQEGKKEVYTGVLKN